MNKEIKKEVSNFLIGLFIGFSVFIAATVSIEMGFVSVALVSFFFRGKE